MHCCTQGGLGFGIPQGAKKHIIKSWTELTCVLPNPLSGMRQEFQDQLQGVDSGNMSMCGFHSTYAQMFHGSPFVSLYYSCLDPISQHCSAQPNTFAILRKNRHSLRFLHVGTTVMKQGNPTVDSAPGSALIRSTTASSFPGASSMQQEIWQLQQGRDPIMQQVRGPDNTDCRPWTHFPLQTQILAWRAHLPLGAVMVLESINSAPVKLTERSAPQ